MRHIPKPLTFEQAADLLKSTEAEPLDKESVTAICRYVKERDRDDQLNNDSDSLDKGVRWVFAKGFSDDGDDIVFTYVNDEFAKMLGSTPHEVIGRSDRHFTKQKEELNGFDEADRSLLNGRARQVFVAHETFTLPNGTKMHLRTTKERIEVNGKPQLVGIARSIDTRDMDEGISCDIQALLNAFQNNVFIKSPTGTILCCNQHFATSHSYDNVNQVIGRCDADHWPEEIAKRFRNDDCRVRYMKDEFGPYDEHLVKEDGTEITLVSWKIPLFDADDRDTVIATIGICEMLSYRSPHDGILKMRSRSECLSSLSVTKNVLRTVSTELAVHIASVLSQLFADGGHTAPNHG